ncbi:MAG: isoprenylcysteine carboxylmethyltransferase family protein [Acidobacteriaceae bacterium]|jgi:protein-S-isoprenylcysteine O-methyltransferase Ste14
MRGFLTPGYFAAATIVLLVAMVLTRALALRARGIHAVHFGQIDWKDFLIPPFALFYFYLVFAWALRLPSPTRQEFFRSEIASWTGVACCGCGLSLMLASLISFGQSFRIGIDAASADKLVTSGVFAFSRNPIYAAFALVLLGELLVFPNWIFLAYAIAGTLLFHRQVLREEDFLRRRYGEEFIAYCRRVPRYL